MKSNSQELASSSGAKPDKKSKERANSPKRNGVVEINDEDENVNDVEVLDKAHTKINDETSSSKPNLQKVDSIQEDAEKIADLLEIRNLEAIRARLRKVQKNPDRIDVVTNQLLEENDDDVCEIIDVKEGGEDGCKVSVVKPSHRSSGHSNRKEDDKDDVMQAMLSDIREVTTLTFLFYTYDKVHKFCFGVLRNQHISSSKTTVSYY